MSASAFQIPDASPDITYLVPEPFELKPLIADILRTQFCVPDPIFLVEGVDVAHTSRSKRWRAIRLLLGDGELCIQALLSPVMHPFVDRGKIDFGSYVRLERFRVEWTAASDEQSAPPSAQKPGVTEIPIPPPSKRMVYLVVDSLVVVGWNNMLVESLAAGKLETADHPHSGSTDHATSDAHHSQSQDTRVSDRKSESRSTSQSHGAAQVEHKTEVDDRGLYSDMDIDDIDAEDEFEVIPLAETRASQKRKELAAETRFANNSRTLPFNPNTISTNLFNPNKLPWTSDDLTRPLKLTNLHSIPHLPFKQNWSVNVLCVVSAISDVEPAGIPPYTQRQARLTDPSTDKHVLLTVFLDPELFAPRVGSVVLLLGVKNHRFDGGSLKKYESDRQRMGGRPWWYENPRQLEWCDVDGLLQWWEAENPGEM
ncbi:hypothetical protein F5Y17DRAFT_86870 [Xylariaceae sp. FL0594]|nr:hypothetical protein F5Y17DRAFT_86870 [Xylariaceae sp. FL0594]